MREIKFRAFNKKNKKMIYFDFNNIYGYEGETCGVILPDEQTELNFNSGYGEHGINKDLEIMQYTGLKDKNGKEIYEGDIVSKETFDDTKPNYRDISYAKVIYIEDLAGFYLVNKDNKILWEVGQDKYNIEVAGNIYDNPELLEV